MIFVEKQSELDKSNDEIIGLVKACCKKNLPDYEIPTYFEVIEKIPYKNGKHDFNELTARGERAVIN
jgi:hypothetical protein